MVVFLISWLLTFELPSNSTGSTPISIAKITAHFAGLLQVNKVLIAILVPTSSYPIKFLSQTKMAWSAKNIKKKTNCMPSYSFTLVTVLL